MEDSLKRFVQNSSIGLLSDGSASGIVYQLTCNPSFSSDYIAIDSIRIRKSINELNRSHIWMSENPRDAIITNLKNNLTLRNIILKVCITTDDINYSGTIGNTRIDKQNIYFGTNPRNHIIGHNRFHEEVEIQHRIFTTTALEDNICEPVAPAILGYFEFKTNDLLFEEKVTQFQEQYFRSGYRNIFPSKINEFYRDYLLPYSRTTQSPKPALGVGFIFMEMLNSDSKPMYTIKKEYEDDPDKMVSFYAKCLYELKRIRNVGYCHCDSHFGNIFYDKRTQKITVIDYGESVTHEEREQLTLPPNRNVTSAQAHLDEYRNAFQRYHTYLKELVAPIYEQLIYVTTKFYSKLLRVEESYEWMIRLHSDLSRSNRFQNKFIQSFSDVEELKNSEKAQMTRFIGNSPQGYIDVLREYLFHPTTTALGGGSRSKSSIKNTNTEEFYNIIKKFVHSKKPIDLSDTVLDKKMSFSFTKGLRTKVSSVRSSLTRKRSSASLSRKRLSKKISQFVQ